ncbi:hypothetical protein BB561_003403 [Smittium simulii]|uniref:Uncharacterized protein n=1 Tax=Smittium simulii TaxID=133385 RepID=A0A2T9YLK4_9FUNG|nr:hypothetical protein BB561_003403 [Smittium simulii]
MAKRDYYDIDDILAVQQRVPCNIKQDIIGLSYNYNLEPSVNKANSKITLPFWIADALDAEEYVEMNIPVAFSKHTQRKLLASTNLNLNALCPYFYKLGERFAELSPNLADFLSHVYLQRLELISNQAQHDSSSEFLSQLDTHEKSSNDRYPLTCSEITSNNFPEIDNLYLDMNGIIHNCTHSNEGDENFDLTEEQMFINIFRYIDRVYSVVNPRKLLYIAVDGVAPLAKINEQRARRYRKILEEQESKAAAGANDPKNTSKIPFDSNCITPGTEFMERLSNALKYYIYQNLAKDMPFKDLEIIYSGYNSPGEGEHKIMEYIRHQRTLPGTSPNIRHCMYGLDADLIMLGLSSHETHFTLLRENITFGRKKQNNLSSAKNIMSQKFMLFNLSVFREYLDIEFSSLKHVKYSEQDIGYDLERIIDDYILLCMLAGNDFMRHLPGIHIGEHVISTLTKIYLETRPQMGGYLHETGKLDMERMQILFAKLSTIDIQIFETEIDGEEWFEDFKYHKSQLSDSSEVPKQDQDTHREILHLISNFALSAISKGRDYTRMQLLIDPAVAHDNFHFILSTANRFGLRTSMNFDPSNNLTVTVSTKNNSNLSSDNDSVDTSFSSTPIDTENSNANNNVFELGVNDIKSITKKIKTDINSLKKISQKLPDYNKYEHKFENWKKSYYLNKLGIDYDVDEVLKSKTKSIDNILPVRTPPPEVAKMCESYLGILQWVLLYYFYRLPSWRYFYPYHYAPRVSDLLCGLSSYKIDKFPKDSHFTPFQQLMSVLPQSSADLVPPLLQGLMLNPTSPIYDCYPLTFGTDLNGKKHSWEAVVLLDFVDTNKIIKAIKPLESAFTCEEIKRNKTNPNYKYISTDFKWPDSDFIHPSPFPNLFPDVEKHYIEETGFTVVEPHDDTVVKGLMENASTGIYTLPGFPTTKTIGHTTNLTPVGIKLFGFESKSDTVVLNVNEISMDTLTDFEKYASNLLSQKKVFVNYPTLIQAKIVAISTTRGLYVLKNEKLVLKPFQTSFEKDKWIIMLRNFQYYQLSKKGIKTNSDIFVHALPIRGMLKTPDGSLVYNYLPENEQHPKTLTSTSTISKWSYTYLASLVLTIDDVYSIINNNLTDIKQNSLPVWADNPKYKETLPQSFKEESNSKEPVLLLNTEELYGYQGYLEKSKATDFLVKVFIPKTLPLNFFLKKLGREAYSNNILDIFDIVSSLFNPDNPIKVPELKYKYKTEVDMANIYSSPFKLQKMLNLSKYAIGMITSMFIIDTPNFKVKKLKLGLELRLPSKGLCVPGYSRFGAYGWEYSNAAINLIETYKQKFGIIIDKIDSISYSFEKKRITLESFIDEKMGITINKLYELHTWINQQTKTYPEFESIKTVRFTKNQVRLLETQIDAAYSHVKNIGITDDVTNKDIKRLNIKSSDQILKLTDANTRLPTQSFAAGDRIMVVLQKETIVPLGSYGFIIGIYPKNNIDSISKPVIFDEVKDKTIDNSRSMKASEIEYLEILLDKPLLAASDLGGICSNHRGCYIKPEYTLNLTSMDFLHSKNTFSTTDSETISSPTYTVQTSANSLNKYPPPKSLQNNYKPYRSGNNYNKTYEHNNYDKNYVASNSHSTYKTSFDQNPQKTYPKKWENTNNSYSAKNSTYNYNNVTNNKDFSPYKPKSKQNQTEKIYMPNIEPKVKNENNDGENADSSFNKNKTKSFKSENEDTTGANKNFNKQHTNTFAIDKPKDLKSFDNTKLIPNYVKYKNNSVKVGKKGFKEFYNPSNNSKNKETNNVDTHNDAYKDSNTQSTKSKPQESNDLIDRFKTLMIKNNAEFLK